MPSVIASNTFNISLGPVPGLNAQIGKLYYFNRILQMPDIATLVNDTPVFS
jgi:hypothetical protein